ncbi:MAG: hypothetical protein AAFQ41_03115 [Cyanobacteria bacterium J06623_7]
MGIFHCVPSGCAEVRYQPYELVEPKLLRYRYPGESWVEIEADDYQINDYRSSSATISVDSVTFKHVVGTGPNRRVFPNSFFLGTGGRFIQFTYKQPFVGGFSKVCVKYVDVFDGQTYENCRSSPSSGSVWEEGGALDVEVVTETIQAPNVCVFLVYRDGNLVYQRRHNACPEVEVLNEGGNSNPVTTTEDGAKCQLSDRIKVIEIEKLPFLERVEVTDFDYQNFGANVFRADIPDNCLVVRKNGVAAITPLPGGIPTPSNSAIGQNFTYGFIQQICSDEGCPPPLYEVVCDCDSEECPAGTCPVICGDTVCCYNSGTGISIDSIPLENYGGGNL